mgnify:FL=1
MSAQTIKKNDLKNSLQNIDNFYICQGNKYLLFKEYDLGKGPDIDKFLLIEKIDEILDSEICFNIDKEYIIQNLNSILIK